MENTTLRGGSCQLPVIGHFGVPVDVIMTNTTLRGGSCQLPVIGQFCVPVDWPLWCTGRLVIWCTGRLVIWCTGRLVIVLVYRLVDPLVYRSVDPLVYRSVGHFVYLLVSWLVLWCTAGRSVPVICACGVRVELIFGVSVRVDHHLVYCTCQLWMLLAH